MRASLLSLLVTVILASPASGLSGRGSDPGMPSDSTLSLEAHTGFTRLGGEWSGLVGASLKLSLKRGIRIGASVARPLRTAAGGRLPTGGEGRIRMAHGGPFLEIDLASGRQWTWAGRLLLGGGHATLTDPTTGTRLDADSFVVLEPAVRLGTKLAKEIGGDVSVSYRWVAGSGGLAGVRTSDLTSPVITFGLTWRR